MCRLRVHSIFFGLYTSSSSIRVLTLFICLHFFVVFFPISLHFSVDSDRFVCMRCEFNSSERKKKKFVVVYIEFFGLENSTRIEKKKLHEKNDPLKQKHKNSNNESAFRLQSTTQFFRWNCTKLILSCAIRSLNI